MNVYRRDLIIFIETEVMLGDEEHFWPAEAQQKKTNQHRKDRPVVLNLRLVVIIYLRKFEH